MLALLLRSTQTRAFNGDLLRAYSADPLKYAFPENEGDEIRRRRLAWHSTKRGMVETELILGSFAKLNLATMSSKELDAYDHILQEADPDIFNWITGKETPKEEFLSLNPVIEELLTRIRKHATVGRTANVQQP